MKEKTRWSEKFLKLHTCLVYAFLYIPIIVLVVFSFNVSKRNAVWKGFTFDWYYQLMHNTELLRALENSLKVGLIATICSTIIGALAALALVRYDFKLKPVFESAIFVPLVIPEIVMGVALLTCFVGLKIRLSLLTVILAHIAFCSSYVAVTVRARLHGFNRTLEEAAMDLGADEWTTFKKVSFPIIFPGILAGGMLAFTLSFDDFVITFFNAGVGSTTLPLKVYSMLKFGITPEINAISTIMLVITFTFVIIFNKLQSNEGS
jgi:spermidine/putrescine transport system permease protein